MRLLILAFALLLSAPGAARAQGPTQGRPNACGDLENKEGILARTGRYFLDPARAGILETLGIEQPGPTAPRSVVDDERVCAPLMGRVRAELGRSGVMPNLRPNGFDFAVFRFGPLLAVVVLGRMTEADFPNAPYGETLIFDGQTQAWLGSII